MFFSSGYGATRMNDIAKRAGVSKRSLYLWHADKATLFRAVINESMNKFELPGLNRALNLQQNIELYASALLSRVGENASFAIGRILGREGWQFPDLEKINVESLRFIEGPLYEILTHFGTGSLQVPRVARYFLAMLMTEHQRRMGDTPDFSLTATSELRFGSGEIQPFVRGLFSYRPSLASTFSAYNFKSRETLNLYVGIRGGEGKWELNAFAKNLLDQRRITAISPNVFQVSTATPAVYDSGYRTISTQAPREFGVTASFNFGHSCGCFALSARQPLSQGF